MPDPVVRKALHAVHAFLLELDGNVFTLFADEGLCTDRKRAPDGLGVVALVGGRELHDVTGCDLHEGWPNTTAIGPLVEQLNLNLRRPDGSRPPPSSPRQSKSPIS